MNDPVHQGWIPLEQAVPSDVFRAEVAAWAQKIGVEPKQVQLRPMKRKWGSCSTAGRVTFDTELLLQPAPFRRKVIVHELLHLKVPNHGPVFRALLRAYVGDDSPVPTRTRITNPRMVMPTNTLLASKNSC